MSTTHALLGSLARGERYGYQLRRELEEEFGPEWRIDFGQLYRLLAVMKRKEWVKARVEKGKQGPDRKVYSITARGRAQFTRWLSQPSATVVRGRDEFPVKLRFGRGARRGQTRRLIAERRRLLEAQHQAHRTLRESANHARDVGRRLLAETRLRQTEGALAALESCAAVIGPSGAREREATGVLVAMGSDDLVVDLLAQFLTDAHPEIRFSASRVGSLEGLIALRAGRAHVAGIHLLDIDSGDYNVPFVKHLMPEEPVVLLHVAQREQGLMVASGNPKEIRRLKDLARRDVRLVNRQRGSGTRLYLFHRLRQARLDPHAITGFDREAPTHAAVAAAIAARTADVGPGIRAVADACGLEFIPLGHERYDLAVPRRIFDSPRLRPLLDVMHANPFRRAAAALSGYDVTRMGAIVANVH